MGNFTRRMKSWTAEKLDLPYDVVMEMPRITMVGPFQLYIENHRGVLIFSENELRLLLSDNGQLLVRGKQLVIRQIWPEEVMLEGRIEHLTYIEK